MSGYFYAQKQTQTETRNTMITMTSLYDVETVNTLTLQDLANVDEYAEPQRLIHANVETSDDSVRIYLCLEKSPTWYQAKSLNGGYTLEFPNHVAARTTTQWASFFNASLGKLKNDPPIPGMDITEAIGSHILCSALDTILNGCSFDDFVENLFRTFYTAHLAVFDAISVFTTGDVLAMDTPVYYFGTELSTHTFGGSCDLATVVFEQLLDTYTALMEQTDIIQSKARKPQSKKAKHNAKRKAGKANRKK